jgi:hypothetical protein
MRQILAIHQTKDGNYDLIAANEFLMSLDGEEFIRYRIETVMNEGVYKSPERLMEMEGWQAFLSIPPWESEVTFIKHTVVDNELA